RLQQLVLFSYGNSILKGSRDPNDSVDTSSFRVKPPVHDSHPKLSNFDNQSLAISDISRQKDGGIDIPHNDKRFAGFSKDCKSLDAEVHRKYLYGVHVASYMRRGLGPDDVEALYKKVHAAIRADPTPKKLDKPVSNEHKRHNPKRLTY
ncbi:60S ribosomal protein L5, partial [Linum perenne]